MESKEIKKLKKEPQTITELQEENRKLQIRIEKANQKIFKLETKHLKQERQIIKLQLLNDKLEREKLPVEVVVRHEVVPSRESPEKIK